MIEEKLGILFECEIIDNDTLEAIKKINCYLREKRNFTEDILEPFLTHMAMAIQRIKNGKKCEEFNENVWSDVVKSPKYFSAIELYSELNILFCLNMQHNEYKYVILHLINII